MNSNMSMRTASPAPGRPEAGSIQGPRSGPRVANGDRLRYAANEGLS